MVEIDRTATDISRIFPFGRHAAARNVAPGGAGSDVPELFDEGGRGGRGGRGCGRGRGGRGQGVRGRGVRGRGRGRDELCAGIDLAAGGGDGDPPDLVEEAIVDGGRGGRNTVVGGRGRGRGRDRGRGRGRGRGQGGRAAAPPPITNPPDLMAAAAVVEVTDDDRRRAIAYAYAMGLPRPE